MYLAALVMLFAMIIWAVFNWKAEWNRIAAVYSSPLGSVPFREYPLSVLMLVGDIVITSTATGILGLGGLFGACGALFLSNLLSIFFFVRKKTSCR